MKPLFYLLLTSSILVACKPTAELYSIGPASTTPNQKYIDSTYISLYGSKVAGTSASSLFGIKQDNGVRLTKAVVDGKYVYEYTYDAQNKLIESKYTFGEFTVWLTRYFYDSNVITKSEYWLNTASENGFEIITDNTLKLQTITTFTYDITNGLSNLITTPQESNNPSTSLQTGFDKNGWAIWSENPKYTQYITASSQTKKSNTSNLYVRDEAGNVVKSSYYYFNAYHSRGTTEYIYDNKRNPYASQNRFPGDSYSPSNVIQSVERVGTSTTTTTNRYEYRPDGYPLKAVSKIASIASNGSSESTKTTEFFYNK